MRRENGTKINQLLKNWPSGVVYTASWLSSQGIKDDLLEKYRKNGWARAVGNGAVARAGDEIDWTGGVWAIQQQLKLSVHIGGKTALEMQGYGHYVPLGKGYQVYLFGPKNQKLPTWFMKYSWDVKPRHVMTNLFEGKDQLGMNQKKMGAYQVTLSAPERAMMEALHLVPHQASFEGAMHLMEGLTTLRPDVVLDLLRQCRSIKVKRLFLYLAEKCNHPWFSKLNVKKVQLGKGKRVIVKGGKFDAKYGITVEA